MRILVTGSRDCKAKDMGLLRLALIEVTAGKPGRHVLVCGGARGADTLFAVAAQRLGWKVEVHPANWNAPCRDTCDHDGRRPYPAGGGDYCPAAGNRRNQQMVDLGADVCVAALKEGARNSGTRDCIRRAEAAGLPVKPVKLQ